MGIAAGQAQDDNEGHQEAVMFYVICEAAYMDQPASFAVFPTLDKAQAYAVEKAQETKRMCRIARVLAEVRPAVPLK